MDDRERFYDLWGSPQWRAGRCGRGTARGRTCRARTADVFVDSAGRFRRACRTHRPGASEREATSDELAVLEVLLE